MSHKPRLSLLRIIEMNIGFFGLQFSFGLQQANMGPIYGFLGADEATSIILQHPIETGGTTIPAGAYTLYIIPQEGEGSKLAFSKAIGKWGVPVDESADQARVALTKEMLEKAVDQLTLSVENNPQKPMSGFIRIKWEKTQFSLPLTVKK